MEDLSVDLYGHSYLSAEVSFFFDRRLPTNQVWREKASANPVVTAGGLGPGP